MAIGVIKVEDGGNTVRFRGVCLGKKQIELWYINKKSAQFQESRDTAHIEL